MASPVTIVGIGDDGATGLMPASAAAVAGAEVLVGGSRHQTFFPDFPGERRLLQGSLEAVIGQCARDSRRIAVLASGDPLFFGIAERFLRELGPERVRVLPHLSSVQLAFSRMGESWQDAAFESIHGRSLRGLAQRIDGRAKVAILTDPEHSPPVVARYLLEFGMTEYAVFVAENLGGERERTSWWNLEDLAGADGFSPLNLVVLRWRTGRRAPFFPLGIEDDLFAQRKPDRGLLTKREVRVLTLSALHLRPDSTVWDIGAGSGSVAIEAARLARRGRVFAVEKNGEDIERIRENMRRFRADLEVIHARAPQGLEGIDDPDAVFIGGSGGELRQLLSLCARRLRSGGRIVINAATIETLHHAQSALEEEGFAPSVLLVQTARSKPILDLHRLEGMNPVFLISAHRKEDPA